MKLKLEGIWTPIPTPLTQHGRVDTEATRRLVDFHIEAGIDGLLPLGTSGEFALLSREEREVLVNTVVDQADSRVPVVAGVSDPSIESVVQLSSDAKKAGADGVIATPPYYFTTTDAGHYHHFKTISEAVDLPLLILEFGGAGAIIGSANVAPRVASKIFDDYKKGDLDGARESQEKLLPVITALGVGKYPAALKEAMSLIGMPVGPVKEPLQALSIAEKRIVAGLLRSGGFLS